MKNSFIFFSCLLSVAVLQAGSLLGCPCQGGKKGLIFGSQLSQLAPVDGGCGCNGGGGYPLGSDEIPPDNV